MFDRIKKILKDIANPDVGIDKDTAIGDLGLDSLDKTEAVIGIEDELNVELPDEIFDDKKTLGELEKEIEQRTS